MGPIKNSRITNPLIINNSATQLKMEDDFEIEFELGLNPQGRRIRLSGLVSWEELVNTYIKSLSNAKEPPGIDPGAVVVSLIIEHLLNPSDKEALNIIRKAPYMPYFPEFIRLPPDSISNVPSFVDLRRRIGLGNDDQAGGLLIPFSGHAKAQQDENGDQDIAFWKKKKGVQEQAEKTVDLWSNWQVVPAD